MKSLINYAVAIVFALLAVHQPALAQDQVDLSLQPYIAYVANAGQHTRCGPSESHYKTDPLKAGQAVEVYLETDDDWLGIRPPENSFCWLQSDQVEVADDEVSGTIVDSAAYSWIGTHLGRAQKYSWQVRLDLGEQVTIIGTARREGPNGEEFWYRIVPPPGEFRWLHRSQVVMSPDEVEHAKPTPLPNRQVASTDKPRIETTAKETAANDIGRSKRRTKMEDQSESLAQTNAPLDNSDVKATTSDLLDSDRQAKEPTSQQFDDQPIGSGLATLTRPTPPTSSDQSNAKVSGFQKLGEQPSGNEVAQVMFADTDAVGGQAGPVLRSVVPQGQPYVPQTDLASANVETLQLELSRAMAASASAIEVQTLRDRCAQLATNAADAVNRGRAALLLQRIDDYRRVVTQRTSGNAVQQASATSQQTINDPVGTSLATGAETKFDRQGWLVKVYSARPNTPPYAITDSAGRTLSYVTPVPGINLRRYLNQEIGLYGRVAFDTSLETPHLIAEQAVRIRR